MNASYFQSLPTDTPNQIRDVILSCNGLSTEFVQSVANMARQETERRKSMPETFIRCLRCYGYHGQLNNIDGLCERCECQTAPFRYDQAHK